MNYTLDQYQQLVSFLGYGTLEAPIWFLGMEEYFNEREDFSHEDNLAIRMKFDKVMDVREASEKLGIRFWETLRKGKLNISPVWKWAAKFTLALLHNCDQCWEDRERVNWYICERLGRDSANSGETLLLELLSLPKDKNISWPEFYCQIWGKRKEYEAKIIPQRIEMIKQRISSIEAKPKYIFCYGKTYHSHYECIFDTYTFGNSAWTQIKLGKKDFRIKNIGSTLVILSPFFGRPLSTVAAKALVDYLRTRT